MNHGFFTIPRHLTQSPQYLSYSGNYRLILITMIEYACWKDMIEMDDHGRKVLVKRGQLYCSIDNLAKWTKVHRSTVYRALQKFIGDKITKQEAKRKKVKNGNQEKSLHTIIWPDIFPILKDAKKDARETASETEAKRKRNVNEERKEEKKVFNKLKTESNTRSGSVGKEKDKGLEKEIKSLAEWSSQTKYPLPFEELYNWAAYFGIEPLMETIDKLISTKKKVNEPIKWVQKVIRKIKTQNEEQNGTFFDQQNVI